MKILILKPSSLGDVVQALPVLRLLKRHLPASEIYWWIDSRLAPLLEGDPDLAGVVRFERQRWAAPRHWPEMLAQRPLAAAQNFDWVIDLQCLVRSGVFAWLANGKLSVGLDEPREGARGFYDLIVPRPSALTHAVDWYLRVLPVLGVPVHGDFQWLPGAPRRGRIAAAQMAGGRGAVDCPPTRRALAEQTLAGRIFAELVRLLAPANPGCRFAILGGEEDARWARSSPGLTRRGAWI